jgi:phenylacetate-coenzyme A ligase PaaK-like adenylate-forming protein
MTEVFEASGATVLCAGNEMPLEKVALTITEFGVNVVAGDAGQLVQLAQYVVGLPHAQKHTLQTQINKALYTSEPMTPAQRSFLKSVFSNVAISSVIGSAEAGPWGVSTSEMTESASQHNYEDFLYDDRLMHLEILPSSILDPDHTDKNSTAPVPNGEKGLMVQTSLQHLRNPLVRYICGDVASFHPIPASIQCQLTPQDASHLRVARVYGRDRNISFDWYGEYFEFPVVQRLFQTESWGILQYQVIRRYHEVDTQEISVVLEIRLLRDSGAGKISDLELAREIKLFFYVFKCNEELFELKLLPDYSGFMRSTTGRKVMNFVDLTRR